MSPIVLPKKIHRTVLFIDGDSFDVNESYAERARRLDESLNGSNIKVDVVTVRNGEFTVEGLTSAARHAGYDQILFSVAPSTDKIGAVAVPKSNVVKGLG